MYKTIAELEKLWTLFESHPSLANIDFPHLSDVKRVMTASFVVDLSLHEIYHHASFVHTITQKLLVLKNNHPDDQQINECAERWLNILKKRNQIPLKIKHHQRLDGECDFRFALQSMEGRPCGFKEIQVLDRHNMVDVQKAVKSIHELDCLAAGISFGDMALVKDTVLSSLMKHEDFICLIAKDQNDQIIGHCWGGLLRNVGHKEKANIFWVMELAKYPDFYDDTIRVGDQLRAEMIKQVKLRKDCDFVGYQHILNHKFHMNIIAKSQENNERVRVNEEEFSAQTTLKYNEDLSIYIRAHFIRANDNNFAYPDYDNIMPAMLKAFWRAAPSAKDFFCGGIAFFGRTIYQKTTHKLLESNSEHRLPEIISKEQKICDKNILKYIILSDKWIEQGKGICGATHVPDTINKLQIISRSEVNDFAHLKACVVNSGTCITRSAVTTLLYKTISIADSPTFVLNALLIDDKTPKEWVELITNARHEISKLKLKSHIK